jgi:two-component system, chemotaxis family, protein-glutamate methylesterase/glutaminase
MVSGSDDKYMAEMRDQMPDQARNAELESVVAIGLSADGLHAIRTVLHGLPAGFDAPILVVMHRAPTPAPALARVIARNCALPVKEGAALDVLEPGHVYLAPPDAHLVVEDGHLQLKHSGRVSFARPSIDVLFRSVAKAYGPRAVGVLLSGGGTDGALGLQWIRDGGGATIVQDPKEAKFPYLPAAAIAADGIDFKVPLAEISPTLLAIVERRRQRAADEAASGTEAVMD